ncbi:MAG: hypothetical protein WBW33_25535, partial [Bryobacteraceae bacterium]
MTIVQRVARHLEMIEDGLALREPADGEGDGLARADGAGNLRCLAPTPGFVDSLLGLVAELLTVGLVERAQLLFGEIEL